LRARLEFVHPNSAPPAAQAHLPFELRGVVGGDMPYVQLTDGQKLVQGGTSQGWRLASISESQVVFDSGGRRAVVPR
jgi:type III secretion protein D